MVAIINPELATVRCALIEKPSVLEMDGERIVYRHLEIVGGCRKWLL